MSSLYPTLVIGIGGTGKSVLLDIRQRLVARFGSYRELRTIGFLALDTDEALDEELSSQDPLADTLSFSASEHLHLTVSDTKMSDIRENLTTHHPALAQWLDRESLIHPSVVTGAGQIRQVGRLALLTNIDRVIPAINDAITSISSASARKATLEYLRSLGLQGIDIRERPLRLFTVGSLIGGTGSGMFLDLGYLLREDTLRVMMSGQQPVSTAIFAVPLAGRSRSGVDTRASAYAALRELNHYSDPNTTYKIEYPDGRRFESHEPPYDFTFLVTTQSGRSTLDGPRALVSMIGRRIMLEATSEFSQKISSNRDNIRKHMVATDDRGCNQNFFTFGLSSIEVPLRSFSTACGARFLTDTLTDLRLGRFRDKKEQFNLDPGFLKDFLKEQGLDEAGLKKRLLRPREGRSSLLEGFTGQLDDLKDSTGKPVLNKLHSLEKDITSALERAQGEGGRSGFAASQIVENAKSLQEQTLPILVALTERLLMDPGKRLIAARHMVGSLKSSFEDIRDKAAGRVQEIPGRIRKGQAALRRHRRELEEIDGDFLLGASPWKNVTFKESFQSRYARDARILWEMMFEEVLFSTEVLLAVLDAFIARLSDLDRRLASFDLFLEQLSNDYRDLAKQAGSTSIPINGKWIRSLTGTESDHEDPVDSAYQAIIGERFRELANDFVDGQLKEYLRSTASEASGGETGLLGLERRGVSLDQLKRDLWSMATRTMTQVGKLENTDVIRAFMQDPDASQTFQQIARLSAPFLELDRSDSKFEDNPGKEQIMIGFADALSTTSPPQQRFRELCDTHIDGVAGHHDERLVPLQNSYQVIFYREYGAFPLRLWTHLNALSQAYERQLERSRLPVHLGGKGEAYLPIIRAAREDLERLTTVYLISSIAGIDVLDRDPESHGTRLDFTEGGLRRVLRFSGSLDRIAERLYELQSEKVPDHLERQISRRRSELGDQEFVRHLLTFRNQLFDLDLTETERERQMALLDRYLESDRGLSEALQKRSSENQESSTQSTGAKADSPNPTLGVLEQIERLGELKNHGVLTEEEFESKKRELLDRM